MAQYTPMIEQYLKVKEQAKDAFLFFRLGDFYEMFFEDATLAAKELEITLTGREGGGGERIPMCGVPYHSADNYIQRLIEKGYKVAICEQMEDAATTKGMVRRDIVRVITPGTVMEGKTLGDKSNNYMVCLTQNSGMLAIAACDLSTGELYLTSAPYSEKWLKDEIGIYEPSELLGDAALLHTVKSELLAGNRPVTYTDYEKVKADLVIQQFGETVWARLGEERKHCLATLFAYLHETQRRSLGQLTQVSTYEPDNYMILDPFTRRNLELVETVRDRSKKGSLLSLIDKTETSMGARMLRRWIDKPLLQKQKIEERLEAVDKLYHQFILREDIREQLKEIYDLERLVGRIAFGNANGRDMNALKVSLARVPALTELCLNSPSVTLQNIASSLDHCSDLKELIEEAIVDEPPVSVRDGGMIREGYHEHLDELRYASVNGKRWIAELEAREREATGIRSLKIGYNKVFGYYIEVTKSNVASLPEGRYERKQTLANAERYITPELKEKESLILEAEEKMVGLEYSLFTELRDKLAGEIKRLQRLAEQVAEIDVYQSLATVSAERGFVKPLITDGFNMKIVQGRHPVVESVMRDGSFMANDAVMEQENPRILLITGPNMAGKSTYMRQVALITILAQMGCFVPAQQAEVPIMDRIFTRIGAGDDLIGGQSTFMVEMADIQIMTEKATPRSLIIIDELGRGTSTSEGMAIAQAVIEYVHDHIGCKALVSTHFHELSHLEESLASLRNYSMAVQEREDEVQFLRKLIPGAASSSYGIYVARLAGLPGSIIERANGLIQMTLDVSDKHFHENTLTTALPDPIDHSDAKSYASSAQLESAAGREQGAAVQDSQQPNFMSNVRALPADEYVMESKDFELAEESTQGSGVVQLSIFGDEDLRPKKKEAQAEIDPAIKQMIKKLKTADLMNMTPLQAMQLVNELKMKANDL